MTEYKAPLRDMKFILNEVFSAEQLWASMPGTAELTLDDAAMILEEGAKICEKELYPLNRSGDEEGCRLEGDKVVTPIGFKEAYRAFVEGGWQSLTASPEYGGQGLPKALHVLVEETFYSTNTSFCLYGSLTAGAYHLLQAHAEEAIKETYR